MEPGQLNSYPDRYRPRSRSKSPEPNTCSVYVGNLDHGTTDKELKEAFAHLGSIVDSKVVSDVDGRSKGYGFVKFSDQETADEAIKKMNGENVDGRTVVCRPARFNRARGRGDYYSNGGRGGRGYSGGYRGRGGFRDDDRYSDRRSRRYSRSRSRTRSRSRGRYSPSVERKRRRSLSNDRSFSSASPSPSRPRNLSPARPTRNISPTVPPAATIGIVATARVQGELEAKVKQLEEQLADAKAKNGRLAQQLQDGQNRDMMLRQYRRWLGTLLERCNKFLGAKDSLTVAEKELSDRQTDLGNIVVLAREFLADAEEPAMEGGTGAVEDNAVRSDVKMENILSPERQSLDPSPNYGSVRAQQQLVTARMTSDDISKATESGKPIRFALNTTTGVLL